MTTRGRTRRAVWRNWRRSRPFWGGLLMVLGGLELLALPLTGVFVRGAIKLVIYIGIGGVFGVLIGLLLIAAGIVVWVNPTHRVFYGIAGIVLGIVSFPASNLGGFLLGMLLAIVGGALAFAWVPVDPGSVSAASAGLGRDDAAADPDRAGESPAGLGPIPGMGGEPAGHRMLAIAALPAVLMVGLLGAGAGAGTGTGGAARAVSTPQSGGNCILGILCLPSPSPSASSSPSASPSPSPTTADPTSSPTPSASASVSSSSGTSASATPSVSSSASPSGTASPSPTPSPAASGKSARAKGKLARKDAVAPSAVTAAGASSVLSAGSATLTDFQYQGNLSMPASGGGTEQMMEFTASSATLAGGVTVAVTQDGLTTDTSSPTLGFSGGMTLYATKLCGNLLGVLPVCFTPSTASAVLLSIANYLTSVAPITMTDVTTDQPLATAGALQTGSLSIGF